MATVADQPVWISYAEAMRRAGIGKPALLELVRAGRLTFRHIPGSRPKVRADELEALIAESTRPATAGRPGGSAA